MFVIEVTPLVRGASIEVLSYFSSVTYPIGSFVSIPVRGKTVSAVVVDSHPVSGAKTALKAATFSLRKLPPQNDTRVVSENLLAVVEKLTTIIPAKRGALLFALLPSDIRTGVLPYPACVSAKGQEDSTPQIVTGTLAERIVTYQGIVRGAFAHRGSVLLVAPTTERVKQLYNELNHGIKDRIVVFHGQQTKRARQNAYTLLTDSTKAVLVITTTSHAYLDRPDYTTIIIDEVGSPHYVERTRPYLDHRVALYELARISGRQCIVADIMTRTEDEYLRRQERATTYGEHQRRQTLSTPLTIIEQPQTATGDTPFQLFSPVLKDRIEAALAGRHNVFLYAARRGLAPVVTCIDCGYIFRCPDSGTPYSLLRTHHPERGEERWLISATSGKRIRAADVCAECGSWRLRERGIGIQAIEDEVKKLFPHTPRATFDATTATTPKKTAALVEQMERHKGAIIIGTSMIMPYLPTSLYLSAIVSLDAVRSIPTWRADESLFRLLLTLREHSSHEVIVQTRSAVDDVLIYATRGATDRFHDDELALRQMLKYPPFATFYFLTWHGAAEHLAAVETMIKNVLAPFPVTTEFYTNPQSKPRTPIRHCLIRVNPGSPPAGLVDVLRQLPPYISIATNPDRIV